MRCAGTIPAVPMHNDESIHAHASAAGCIVGGSNAAELHNVCRMCAPRGRVAPRCVRETLAERAVISPEAPAGGPRTALRASCVRDGSESSSSRGTGQHVGRPDECVCESVSLCGVCHGECVTASRRCKTKMDIYTRADATHQVSVACMAAVSASAVSRCRDGSGSLPWPVTGSDTAGMDLRPSATA